MSKTTIKKGATVNVKTKSGATYSYKFITLAQIHEWLDDNGLSYEATIKRVDDREYMFITKIDKEGNKSEPMQGSRIPAFGSNDSTKLTELMQDYGSVLAMARRYSLMMVYGLAPADDEEQPKPQYTAPDTKPKSGRYGAPAGDIDFDEVDAKLAECETLNDVEAYWAELQKGDMTWRQKSTLENKVKKRRQWIIADNK